MKTGRYIQRAIAGQMNYHVLIVKDWGLENALFYGKRYADHFAVKSGLIADPRGFVKFAIPPVPTDPPADGIGPRPTENNGR